MKLSQLKKPQNNKPFLKTPKFTVTAKETDGKITEFTVTDAKGTVTSFLVKKMDILYCWKKVEKHCEKLL